MFPKKRRAGMMLAVHLLQQLAAGSGTYRTARLQGAELDAVLEENGRILSRELGIARNSLQ